MRKNWFLIFVFGLAYISLSAQNGVGIGTTSPAAKLDVQALGDGAEILRLTTDRPWVFKQGGTGSTTRLVLESTVDLKGFEISSLGGINRAAQFLTSTSGSSVRLVPDGGAVGIGFDGLLTARLHIQENSHLGHPQIRLTEEGYDYARIKMENTFEPGTYWDIAGRADSTLENAKLNFFFLSPNGWGDRMTIRGTGDVGIGTSSPEAKLDIIGGDWNLEAGNPGDLRIGNPTSNLRIGVATGGGGAGISRIFSTNTLWIGTDNTRRITIQTDGKVGIGLDNPTELLHVNGTFRVNDLAGTGDRNVIVDGNGKFKIGTVGMGDNDWIETANDVYNTTHDVGIGTSNPGSKLHVVGPESNGTTGALKLTFPGTAPFFIDAHSMTLDGNEIDVNGNISSVLDLQGNSAGGIRMVQGGGNVGIGTNAATNKKLLISGQSIPSTGDPTVVPATLSLINTSGGFSEMILDGNEISTVDESLHLNKLTNHDVVIASGGGDVLIGTTNAATGYRLSVAGKVIAEEMRVQLQASWPDYVFKQDYDLMPLHELKAAIREYGHLPGIPAAVQLEAEGMDVGEMQRRMMEKIEELTLYIIDVHERLEALENENRALRAAIKSQ